MSKFSEKYVRISLSSTFVMRSRCKYCSGLPKYYSYSKNITGFLSPSKIRDIFQKLINKYNRICDDYYEGMNPVFFKKISEFSFPMIYYTYSPKVHKNKGIPSHKDFTENLMCPCGKTMWMFYEKSAKSRPEIIHRKSGYKYSQKFER